MAQFEYYLPLAFRHPYPPSASTYSFPPITPPGSSYDHGTVQTDFAEADDFAGRNSETMDANSCDPSASSSIYPYGYQLGQPFEPKEELPPSRMRIQVQSEAGVNEDDHELPMTSKDPIMLDMNMAPKGSVEATPGINTPLSNYVAHMFCWLWYDQPRHATQPPHNPLSPLLPNPFLNSPPQSTINPLQVAPSYEFSQFVETLLRVTLVSHSVTLLALLYMYRLKSRNHIVAQPGTEQRPFIASLILGNKYLDDNTYTNKTWAELTGLATADINEMEQEFLKGLDFNLKVDKVEYDAWRRMLDGYILSRERVAQNMATPVGHQHTPPIAVPSAFPYAFPPPSAARSQSESPPHNRNMPFYRGAYNTPGYEQGRKRSAAHAFAADVITPAIVHEALRQPAGRAQLHIPPPAQVIPGPHTAVPTSSESSLGRSSSLTRSSRQIARYPHRRGSLSGIQHFVPSQDDLRHTATQHAAMAAQAHLQEYGGMNETSMQGQGQGQGWQYASQGQAEYGSLVRPYNGPAPLAIPPENMEFYTVSARAHPGQDGAPRKGILHHQAPAAAYYAPEGRYSGYAPTPDTSITMTGLFGQQTPFYQPSPADIDLMTPANAYAGPSTLPAQATHHQATAYPSIPGNFANAGLPGYLYEPHNQGQFHYNGVPGSAAGNSHSHTQGLEQLQMQQAQQQQVAQMHGEAQQFYQQHQPQQQQPPQYDYQHYQARSQWSSPLPAQFHLFRRA